MIFENRRGGVPGLDVLDMLFNQFVQTAHGPLLCNKNDQYVGASLIHYGEFSEGEASLFRQLLAPGSVVVEAGANIGAHTVQLSRLAGESGAVFAFEPQRTVFQTLCANLALNECLNVVAKQEGLGRQAGEMVLPNVDPRQSNNFGGLSLLESGQGERVAISTIDRLGLARCDLIKADVEGMELAVLEGAGETIRRCAPILYLENDRSEKSAQLIQHVLDLDYRIWWHTPMLFNPNNFLRNPHNIFGGVVSINILCLPRASERTVTGFREVTRADAHWQQAD